MVTEKSCIYQNNEYTCLKNKKVEPVKLVQMNIYQSNAHRENLSWLHFDDERKKVKDRQSCISVLRLVKQYQEATKIYGDTEQSQETETS